MIIPLTTTGFWYDAVQTGPDEWRIVVHAPHGDFFFDSATYNQENCERIVNKLNSDILVRRKDR